MDGSMSAALRRAADLVEDLLRKLYDGNLQGTPWSISVIRDAAEKLVLLAAYEATGLTPEEIINAQETLRCFDNIGIKRGNEIVTAEEEGRLLVLPCKEGTKVYIISHRLNGNHEIVERFFSLTYNRPEEFGKTVFLTREEAEAALKGADNG